MTLASTVRHQACSLGFYILTETDESGKRASSPTAADIEFQVNNYWANHSKLPSVIAHKARVTRLSQPPPPPPRPAYNPFEDHWSGRQLDETVDEFLRRLPVVTTTIPEAKDAWLWVANPYAPREERRVDIGTLKQQGVAILEAYREKAVQVELELEGKGQAMIMRRLSPMREELKDSLLWLASKTGVVTGKVGLEYPGVELTRDGANRTQWMLFPSAENLPRTWRLVVEGTISGKLGTSAKVAVDTGRGGSRLICIYTFDFTDTDDVKRVLEGMVELGLIDTKARPIYYKVDAYTHLEIEGANPYGLKNSLWSSKEVLEGTAFGSTTKPETAKRKQSTLDGSILMNKRPKH
jgi:hypothetical protein